MMRKLNVAIVDDNEFDINEIKRALEEVGNSSDDMTIITFNSGMHLLESSVDFNLIIMDIELNESNNGIEYANQYTQTHNSYVFYISSSQSNVFQVIQNYSYDFIRKTCLKDDLMFCLSNFYKWYIQHNQFIVLKSTITNGTLYGLSKLNMNDIVYIKSEGNYINISFLYHGKIYQHLDRVTLKEFTEQLNSSFVKINKGLVINVNYLSGINRLEAKLDVNDDQIELKISRIYLSNLKKVIRKDEL